MYRKVMVTLLASFHFQIGFQLLSSDSSGSFIRGVLVLLAALAALATLAFYLLLFRSPSPRVRSWAIINMIYLIFSYVVDGVLVEFLVNTDAVSMAVVVLVNYAISIVGGLLTAALFYNMSLDVGGRSRTILQVIAVYAVITAVLLNIVTTALA